MTPTEDMIGVAEKRTILDIPLPLFGERDRLVWPAEKSGKTAVKSAYQVIKSVEEKHSLEDL